MGHKSKHHHKQIHPHPDQGTGPAAERPAPSLELVVKADTDGTDTAVCDTITSRTDPALPVKIIHKGVGDISKTDIITAATGSRLVVGFNVDVLPKIEELCREQGVEVRLYSVIYTMQEDVNRIAESLLPRETEEEILGSARIIALFKSSRRGIIIGCEVNNGRLQAGDRFRLISGMGPVYDGIIESMKIEKNRVDKATPGQQVGIKIENFKDARKGYLVEAYKIKRPARGKSWQPSGKIITIS